MINNFLKLLLISFTLSTTLSTVSAANIHSESEGSESEELAGEVANHDYDNDDQEDDIFGGFFSWDVNENLAALANAAYDHNINVLVNHLHDNPESINEEDQDNAGILHQLAFKDDEELSYNEQLERVQLLIFAGANINAQDKDGDTPLHKAAMNANYNALTALIEAGADINLAANNGKTPLSMVNAHLIAIASLNAQNPDDSINNESALACRNALIAAAANN